MQAQTTCRVTAQAGAPRTSAGSKAGSKPSLAKTLPKVAGGVLGGLLGLSAGDAHAEKYVIGGSSAAIKAVTAAAPAAASTSLPSLPAAPSVSLPSFELPSVDLPSLPSVELPSNLLPSDLLDSLAANPLLLAGAGVLLVGLPLAAKALSAPAPRVLGVSPRSALEALTDDPRTLLVDIRSREAAKAAGSPDLSAARKKAFALPLIQVVKGEASADEGFGEKVARLPRVNAGSLIILIDESGAEASAAGRLIEAALDVERVYFVKGGAAAWQAAGLPWKTPSKFAFPSLPNLPNVDLSSVEAARKDVAKGVGSLVEEVNQAPTLTKVGLVAGAAVGGALLLANGVEVLLELTGIWAVAQFGTKLLFADDREKTFTEIKTITDKVAVTEAGKDLKKIATVLLEDTTAPKEAAAPKAAAATPAAEPAAPAAEPAAPAPPAAPSASDDKPANVKEARAWIDDWKAEGNASA